MLQINKTLFGDLQYSILDSIELKFYCVIKYANIYEIILGGIA